MLVAEGSVHPDGKIEVCDDLILVQWKHERMNASPTLVSDVLGQWNSLFAI